MRVLFVCSRNRLRSPTAEAVFAGLDGLEVSSAGTSVEAETTVSGDLIEWADTIFVMEKHHKKRLTAQFGSLLRNKKLVVLGIADDYGYMDTELVKILKVRVLPNLGLPH